MVTLNAKRNVGPIVVGSLLIGLVTAAGLMVGPLAGSQEHAITGAALLGIALGWSLLAWLSVRLTDQPQRWAWVPAAYFGLAGAGVLLLAPDASDLDRLGWLWPPLFLALLAWMIASARQSLQSKVRVWFVYPMLSLYALASVGAFYQSMRDFQDRQALHGSGSLIDVGGHRLFLSCTGSGGPTVVLESGLGATSAGWDLIAKPISEGSRVCVYDRAGKGSSDPVSAPQDGASVATDLHTLLTRANIDGPYVVAGHSTGGQYVLIFAAMYPDDVAGVVLVDAQPSQAFTRLPDYPAFYVWFRRASATFPVLARIGVARAVFDSSARQVTSLRNEFLALPATLAQGRGVQTLGATPLVVISAGRDTQPGWPGLQDELATLSTRVIHHVRATATHTSLLDDPEDAIATISAIREVAQMVRIHR